MSGQIINIGWKSPGPVSSAFMASNKRVQFLNGPVGGGKTTTNFVKHLRYASRQKRSTRDGTRKYKLCVVRDTYRQIWKTTLPTWWKRIPRDQGEFVGAENAPATHRVNFELPDRSIVNFQVDFVGIGENAVEDVLRGYEPTAFMLNEADLLAREVYTFARGRWGRYPDMSEGGPDWWGITGDANAPELESWLYTDIFDDMKRPPDVDLFIQPSGFSPSAENTENLPPNYYTDQAQGAPEWYIARMIENRPGYSRGGKPIFTEFRDTLHVSTRAQFVPHLPLHLGLDAGGSPAAVLGQRMPNGQWRIFDELVAEQGTGSLRFGAMLAQLLHAKYSGARTIVAHADPSAAYGADKQAGELDWIEIVSKAIGIVVSAAPTNRLAPRLEAVRKPLSQLIDGEPAFLLNPCCVVLRKGFNSGYRYRKVAGKREDLYHDEPEKNECSHPHDALQYLMSAGGEDLEIRDRKLRNFGDVQRWASQAQTDWDPLREAG
jgi:hypothetical protein